MKWITAPKKQNTWPTIINDEEFLFLSKYDQIWMGLP